MIARRFLAVRASLKLSQKQFADGLGISLRAEQNYERGDRKVPAEVFLGLARRYGIDPLWAMEGPGEIPKRLNTKELDTRLLAKAHQLIRTAIRNSGKKVSEQQSAEWVAAVYRFYLDSDEAEGAQALVGTLIRSVK